MSKLFDCEQFILVQVQFQCQTVLVQAIQCSISIQFSSIRPISRTLSGATTPGQSESGCYDNKGVLRIPQSFSMTGTSPSDCLVSYPWYLLGGVFPLCRGVRLCGDRDEMINYIMDTGWSIERFPFFSLFFFFVELNLYVRFPTHSDMVFSSTNSKMSTK